MLFSLPLDPVVQSFLFGGLVFTRLTADYLRVWGDTWWDKAPKNLLHDYYTIQARLVGVLPAKYMATDSPEAVLRRDAVSA